MALEDVRTEIQDIDFQILGLMKRRLELAKLVGEDKVARNAAVRNIPQENKVIDRYRGFALENGMNPVYAEKICRILMQESIEIQAALPRTTSRMRHIAIVGGYGKMGRWFADLLKGAGHRVDVIDPSSGNGLVLEDAKWADAVIVSVPTLTTGKTLNRISNIFLTAAVFVVLISVLAVTAFARRESKPLRDMAKAANDFAHGNLEARVRVEEDYSEEVEELALAFNNMASSLQKSEYRRQEFVANVSHELKTPMTTISGYIDGILDGTIPPERRAHYLQIVSDETKRLSRLVRSMLDISQLQQEQGIPEEQKIHFDLEECAGQVLITFEKKINDKGINVDVDFPPHPVFTVANQDSITQVIYNLIDNAVKFCPRGGTLGLKIREGNSKAYVSVSNDGDTIPPEELPLVFDRFHKLDKSRSRNRDGWGLGLYIVKTIVCSHGENISVSSKDGKTEFTFTMPLVT